ncbi:MAG: hypothetical protein K6G26_08145 [Lachnospiraceae bacterium]|nr:hypothetical protein [Lachnospiraceae bacterium]
MEKNNKVLIIVLSVIGAFFLLSVIAFVFLPFFFISNVKSNGKVSVHSHVSSTTTPLNEEDEEAAGEIVYYEKEERQPMSFMINSFEGNFDTVLKQYVHDLNNWQFEEIIASSATNSIMGTYDFWTEMDGSVYSSQVIEDEENYKLVKIVLDITKPGVSLLKEGKNTKYVYIAKIEPASHEQYWAFSPMFDTPDELEKPHYTAGYIDSWDYQIINGGYGFCDDKYYGYSPMAPEELIPFDLDGDGIKDIIDIEETSISHNSAIITINKGKDNEATAEWKPNNAASTAFNAFIIDYDPSDNYLNLALHWAILKPSPSFDDVSCFNFLSIYQYDGKNLTLKENAKGNVDPLTGLIVEKLNY